ncbi:MAG TPA: glycosyltransferase family 4 protein [Anaerolineaceae bacterium]|jgi:glycosyltransferase involved in cell wall biosynthesis|nr:glycosyltransferase family 4 protein [Anaerolineaceae bacterium]
MNILIALTYYRPHYSGLTIYTERLARALARHGHRVMVLTSRFDPNLPGLEIRDGVEIYRPRVLMRISKGVIMPTMPIWAFRLIRQADIVNLHVPQLDAAPISVMSRLMGRPVVLTYHCDLHLPRGFVHKIANGVSNLANHVAAMAANRLITNTRDYAESSPFLQHYLSRTESIVTPAELPPVDSDEIAHYREAWGVQPGQRVIGMAARFATEKGVEYLVEAMPAILQRYPTARVLFVGQHDNVLGEEEYARRLAPLIDRIGPAWKFLGVVPSVALAAFFHMCEVTVLPSINGTESFGIVQIESMMSGTPVVATDLPGVRQPVRMTGMGRVVPPRNAAALAEALIDVLDHPAQFRGDPAQVAQDFSPDTIAAHYEKIFGSVCS